MSPEETTIKLKKSSNHTLILLPLLVLFLSFGISVIGNSQDQKVGVVLSGGGATATAHLGFLKALEENNIPIDFITGSSMGAIVGAFYAAGYSIDEIEQMLRSDEFVDMSQGNLPDELTFYLREDEPDGSLVNVRFDPKSIVENALPTHLLDPVLMDFKFVELFGPASAAANYDFDNLFIPYRALASDIEKNESFIFREGELNLAARASGTFPFYIEPITINGKMLFDGGLYNNYPADVLYAEFLPDIILGCNVSQNQEPPKEGNLMSQLVNMIQYQTDFDKVCDEMITIEPICDVTTFDFDRVGEAIDAGYLATSIKMDSIKLVVEQRVTEEEIILKRQAFRSQFKPILIKQLKVEGLAKIQEQAIINSIIQKQTYITLEEFQRRFFRLYADYQVRYAYPTLEIDPLDGKYIATVHVKSERKVEVSFGGNFSSNPTNMGFLQAKYNIRGRNNINLFANSYFGKFYSSTKAGFKLDLNFKNPMTFEANYTYNSWDYFSSFATFLEEVKPSFIVKNEQFIHAKVSVPVANRGKLEFGSKYARLYDDYYQTNDFINTDTTDQTNFKALIFTTKFERSTLDRKQFASSGTFLQLSANYLNGEERTIPGSTSQLKDTTNSLHNWTILKGKYVNYFHTRKRFNLGFQLESAWAANQPRFSNYRATLIKSLAYEPIPDSRSFFIDQYRSNFYSSLGFMATVNLSNNFQIRGENHVYRPWERIFATPQDESEFEPTSELFYIGSGSLIYHSPIGPLRLTVNYFDRKEVPWSVMFNFGYFIFNQGALD